MAYRIEDMLTELSSDELKNLKVFITELLEERKETETPIVEIVEEFFKRRFADKDLAFEKKCGYFGEWVKRFESGNPETFMDSDSLIVLEQMKKEGLV